LHSIRVLFLGDVVGRQGLRALFIGLSELIKDTRAQLIAVNGENLAGGFGLTPEDKDRVFDMGVSVITSGNHIWQRQEIYPALDADRRLLRPENYPQGVPGHGSVIVETEGVSVAFLNLQGRERMGTAVDCPFRVGTKSLGRLRKKTRCVIVDFHAEDVREKEALSFHLDGRVSAVLGTHTHVATTDERITSGGTAVITDLGMCGPMGSVIGTCPELSIRRSLTQLPIRMEVHDEPACLQGVIMEIETGSGRATAIERVLRVPDAL